MAIGLYHGGAQVDELAAQTGVVDLGVTDRDGGGLSGRRAPLARPHRLGTEADHEHRDEDPEDHPHEHRRALLAHVLEHWQSLSTDGERRRILAALPKSEFLFQKPINKKEHKPTPSQPINIIK